jgi:folate-binding protein YgfZ
MALQYAALRDWVCLEARGDDAAVFLHGQLSRAVLDLAPGHAPLAGWADARGRVRAVLRVCRLPERWLLVTPRDGADELTKKLRMFVLRSKVTLEHAPDMEVAALLGDDDPWLARHGLAPGTLANQLVRRDDVCFVRVGPSYWQALGAPAALAGVTTGLTATSEAAATLAEIELGIPAITKALSERFVAQMLNLDELAALSFDKGCYPGQEIIARVHNLGGVKRRARRYAARGEPPALGTAVLAAGAPVGEVVRSAGTESGCELLAVVDHAAAHDALTCNGAALRARPLPFDVPSD